MQSSGCTIKKAVYKNFAPKTIKLGAQNLGYMEFRVCL